MNTYKLLSIVAFVCLASAPAQAAFTDRALNSEVVASTARPYTVKGCSMPLYPKISYDASAHLAAANIKINHTDIASAPCIVTVSTMSETQVSEK